LCDDDDDDNNNNNNNCGDFGISSSSAGSCDGSHGDISVRNINTFTIHRHVSIIHARLSSEYGAVWLHTFTYLSTASADVPLSSFPPVTTSFIQDR